MAHFRPGVRMTILIAVTIPLSVGLGFWQIDRAAQKRAIEEARLASYGALPIGEQQLIRAPAFASARVEGRYDAAQQFFVDNNTHRGAPGYAVVTVFNSLGGQRVLVNRGWVAAPSSRARLPNAPAPQGQVRIVGTLWAPSKATRDTSAWDSGWPKRVEYFDAARMSETVGGAVPIELRLDESQSGSLEPIIVGEDLSARRHTAYAVQWFSLAGALAVAFVILGLRRGRDRDG